MKREAENIVDKVSDAAKNVADKVKDAASNLPGNVDELAGKVKTFSYFQQTNNLQGTNEAEC